MKLLRIANGTIKKKKEDQQLPKTDEEELISIPWTGNSFGLSDLNFLAAGSNPLIIGVTGVADAGKTSFLATLYCLIRNGRKIGNYQFSGSLTLTGWENIAWYLSWKENNEIQYPPHTSSNAGRVPGLLHLAIKNQEGLRKDLIFTDAPGEWFNNWTYNKNDENAAGARWIHQNADSFLLFADCETLSSPKRGIARNQIKLVADRLKENLGARPLGLIWSKSDLNISSEMKLQITNYIQNSHLENYQEFQTSVRGKDNFHQSILDSVSWILEVYENQKNPEIKVKVSESADLFLSKR